MGRPTKYTQELADRICEQLATGISMRTVCKEEDMPSLSTVFRWIRENEEFQQQYARAKEESADALIEEIQDIADDGTNDYMEIWEDGESAGYRFMGENVQRSKLRVEARKWIASKQKPKKYGEKVDITSDGEKVQPILGGTNLPSDTGDSQATETESED